MTKAFLGPPSPSCAIRHLEMALGQFGVSLPPLPARSLGRHVAGREGVIAGLLFGRRRSVSTLGVRSYTRASRRPPQGHQTGRREPLHPKPSLGLGRRPVASLGAYPPRYPPLPFLARHGRKRTALVGISGVEAVTYAVPYDHGMRVARSGTVVGNRDVLESRAANRVRDRDTVGSAGRTRGGRVARTAEVGKCGRRGVDSERSARHLRPEVAIRGNTSGRRGRAGREDRIASRSTVSRGIGRSNRKSGGLGRPAKLRNADGCGCRYASVLCGVGYPCPATNKGSERRSSRSAKLGVHLCHGDGRTCWKRHDFPSSALTRAARPIMASRASAALSTPRWPPSSFL